MSKPFSVALLAVLALTAFAFWPSLLNGFTNWDDPVFVTRNFLVQSPLSFESVRLILFSDYCTTFALSQVPLLSLHLDHQIFGLDPAGYHAVNLLFHLANVALVFFLFRRFFGSRWLVAAATLFFAIHPLRVESVAWVSERKDMLMALFFLLSCLSYLSYRESKRLWLYLGSLFCFTMSVYVKAGGIALPLVFILFDYVLDGRFDRRRLADKGPFIAIMVFITIVTLWLQVQGWEAAAVNAGRTRFMSPQNLQMICYAPFIYLSKIAVPTSLSCLYPFPANPDGSLPAFVRFSPVLFPIVMSSVFLVFRRCREFVLGFLFFFLMLAPCLEISCLNYSFIQDRYTYLPSIGIAFLVAALLRAIKDKRLLRTAAVFFAAWLAVLGVSTVGRCEVWRDSESLWNDALRRLPNSSLVLGNLASAKLEKKDIPGAIALYSRAVRLNSREAVLQDALACALAMKGDYEGALRSHDAAIRLGPMNGGYYANRALTYFNLKRFDKATEDCRRALQRDQRCFGAYWVLGRIALMEGDPSSARVDLAKAIEISPASAEARFELAKLLGAAGELDRALAEYDMILRLNPSHVAALNNRAAIRFLEKKYSLAWKDIERLCCLGESPEPKLLEDLRHASPRP